MGDSDLHRRTECPSFTRKSARRPRADSLPKTDRSRRRRWRPRRREFRTRGRGDTTERDGDAKLLQIRLDKPEGVHRRGVVAFMQVDSASGRPEEREREEERRERAGKLGRRYATPSTGGTCRLAFFHVPPARTTQLASFPRPSVPSFL